jgi:iron complex outermembrane receptor protein
MNDFAQFSNKVLITAIRSQALALVLAGGALTAFPAMAQDQQDGLTLEEVIVTATRRETSLMDTGISVTAFSSEKLQEFGIDDLNDLSVNTPGLSVTTGERITIRGVGIDSLALGIDAAVGTYVDGYFTNGVGPFWANNFFDVERIEVLRGPQGTLYGRNTAAGAVNVISKKPQQEFEGEVNLEVGNEGYSVVQGMLNIPLGDRFAWRMSASQLNRGALQKNDAGPDVDKIDNTMFDTTLRADWSDSWQTDLRVFTYTRDGRPSSRYQLNPYLTDVRVFPGATTINHTWNWDQPNPAVQDPGKTSQDFANTLDEDYTNAILTNIFSMGDIDIKYIGGYGDFLRESAGDVDWSSNLNSSSVNNIISDSEQMTHELQFISDFDGKLNFIAGLYYFEQDSRLYYDFQNATDPIYSTSLNWDTELVTLAFADFANFGPRFPVPAPWGGPLTLPGALMSELVLGGFRFADFQGDPQNRVFWFDTDLDVTSYAGYGQINYDFTDNLQLTVGGRYTFDEKKGSEVVYAVAPMYEAFNAVIPLAPGVFGVIESETHKAIGNSIAWLENRGDTASDKMDWDNVSGMVSLDYTLESGDLMYGSISTGYRAGGFNLGTLSPGVDSFDEETITSYELGYKGSLVDDTLLLELAAYYYDYSDLQVNQAFVDPDSGTSGTEFTNAAEAEVKGLEAQFTWLVSESFRFSGSYAYNNAKYKDFPTIDRSTLIQLPVNYKGNRLNRAPENKIGLSASYYVALGNSGDLLFSGIYTWVDEMYTNPANSENGRLDSWDRLDARVTWTAPSDKLAITAFIKNIADDRHSTDASGGTISDGFLRTELLSDPRMYGLQLNYRF